MITVRLSEEQFLEELAERVGFWCDDDENIIELYRIYYQGLIDSGCFEYSDYNIQAIVDNDYINWLSVYDDEELANNSDWIDDDRILASYNGLYLVNAC